LPSRRDYYAVLGIPRSAAPDEIKKAFRGLAMEFHPDRRPDDPEADDRFREVAEAYKVLSDPEQRTRYDRLGPFFRPDGRPPSPDDLNDFVSDALSGLFRKKRPDDRGDDLKYTLSVSLEDVVQGAERTIDLRRQSACRKCEGTGADPDEGRAACEACTGTGKSATRRIFRADCPRCDGRGWRMIKKCGTCSGSGTRENLERLKIRVPPGVATGQKLKLRGKGNVPRGGGPPGDLYVLVNVTDHELFRRRGADLFCDVPLLFAEAAMGTDLVVPTLEGRTTIRIPAGTPSGKVFRLSGRGLPDLDGRRTGDLHIKVNVEVPAELNAEQRRALSALSSQLGADAHPRRRQYDDALRART
jgi:molecular chaperone DnaJ